MTNSSVDKRTEGLATGILALPGLSCGPDPLGSGTTYCTPSPGANGARPDLRINTKLSTTPSSGSAACKDASAVYHSWSLESWSRKYEITPGTFSPKKGTDTGPTFKLRSLGVAAGTTVSCVTEKDVGDGVFEGTCGAPAGSGGAGTTSGKFRFDSSLNILSVEQRWECGDG